MKNTRPRMRKPVDAPGQRGLPGLEPLIKPLDDSAPKGAYTGRQGSQQQGAKGRFTPPVNWISDEEPA